MILRVDGAHFHGHQRHERLWIGPDIISLQTCSTKKLFVLLEICSNICLVAWCPKKYQMNILTMFRIILDLFFRWFFTECTRKDGMHHHFCTIRELGFQDLHSKRKPPILWGGLSSQGFPDENDAPTWQIQIIRFFSIIPRKICFAQGVGWIDETKKNIAEVEQFVWVFGGGDRGETLGCLNFNPLSNMVSCTHYSRIPVIKGGMSLSSI